jgi:hydrogenase maturation factor
LQGGKLPPDVLRSVVLGRIRNRNPEVLVHASLGEDSAVIDFGDYVCALSVDPITGADEGAGWLAVHVSCNDVAANGTTPVGVLLSVLCPEAGYAERLEAIMTDAERAAGELGIEILGGHTEVMPGLCKPIITVTAVGKAPRDRLVTSGGARPGDQLLLTKGAGIEGTAILAYDYGDILAGRVPPGILERARGFVSMISVVKEGILAATAGATAMHDVTEGGVLGAVYEMAEASGTGVEVWACSIPILEETRAICEALEADPLSLISSGAMLIAAREGECLKEHLEAQGVRAEVIGRFTPGSQRVLITGNGPRTIAPPQGDELWRVRARLDALLASGSPGRAG